MSESILKDFFDTATFKRGQVIRSRVRRVNIKQERKNEFVTGEVGGSSDETYDVSVLLQRNQYNDLDGIGGVCDCPMGFNCKHVVALLLEAQSRGLLHFTTPEPADVLEKLKALNTKKIIRGTIDVAPPEAELDKTLNTWFSNAPKPESAASAAKQSLLFSLANQNGVVKYLVWTAKMTTKGWTEVKAYRVPIGLEQLPTYAKRDRALLQALQATATSRFYQPNSEFTLEDSDLVSYLLERLLSTERCYWLKPQSGVLLQAGAARVGTPAWVVQEDGSQIPIFNTEPASQAVLPLTPLYYVDHKSGELGLLGTSLEVKAAKHFASCPSVQPEMLFAFRDTLRQRFPTIPEPSLLNAKEITLPCQTILTLKTHKAAQNWQSDLHYASLEFAYGSTTVTEGDKREMIAYHEGILERTKRDAEIERNAVMSLQALNFRKAVAGTIPKVSHAWTLGAGIGTNEAWLDFLNRFAPTLRELGWQILEDSSWAFKIAQIEDWYGSVDDKNDWFGLELGVIVEGKEISLLPILSSMIAQLPKDFTLEKLQALPDKHIFYATLPDRRMLALPATRVRAVLGVLLELYSDRPKGPLRLSMFDAARLLELQEALQMRWHGADRLLELAKRLRSFAGIAALNAPQSLEATLRPYQLEGVAWLQFLREYNLAGVLADDMGLGKTVQALAHLLVEQQAGRLKQPAMVVMPTSLVTNWKLETARFAPSLKVAILHGQARDHSALEGADLILTTYPILLRDFEKLKKKKFHTIILDEAQYIKNAKSSTAQAASALKAEHRICLTGTPLENHLGELWSIYNFLMPGFLGDDTNFKQIYRNPIEKGGDLQRRDLLARRVKPFLLRRTKGEVAKELPEKTEIIVPLELEGTQRDLYETIRVAVSERIREEVANKGLARSQIVVLDALLKLRQACCDPRLVKLEQAKSVKHNAKLEWLEENLPPLVEDGRKILLFSAFASLLGNLETTLTALKISYSKLTGQTKDRAAQINAFQDGDNSVFLISLKAGGVGLNLTAADTVIHFDPWWNPAAENQATDRAHRIGQTKSVFVYKLITQGSLEQKILELQQRKAELAKGILEGGLSSAVALTQDDLSQLLAPLA